MIGTKNNIKSNTLEKNMKDKPKEDIKPNDIKPKKQYSNPNDYNECKIIVGLVNYII